MTLSTIFRKSSKAASRRQVNVLSLKTNDTCYYGNHTSPFMVTETGVTSRGVYYVEIKNPKSGRSHIFTDYYPVLVD